MLLKGDSGYSTAADTLKFRIEVNQMQFTSMQKTSSTSGWPEQNPTSFFDLHPIGAILRGLLMSSLLWVLLALALYSVYSFVVTK